MEGLNYFQVKRGMGGREGERERERDVYYYLFPFRFALHTKGTLLEYL